MTLIRGNALSIPLSDESVDLIVTSPPYFALRSYTDGGEHYDGQIGSEATPAAFIAALLAVTRECVRVLKPSGSLWVNLGDKYAGSGGHNNGGLQGATSALRNRSHSTARDSTRSPEVKATRRSAPDRYNQASDGIRPKSLMGLPWRYAIGCIDDFGLILRAEVIWSKPNGLPESVTDRVRRSHEQWFHFTREPRYYSSVDEIREPASDYHRGGHVEIPEIPGQRKRAMLHTSNPLGKLPGSVWTIPTEPLRVPDHLPQHFAAFPSEWPRRIILGWSPSGICTACGHGRRPLRGRSCEQCGDLIEAHGQRCPSCGHSRGDAWKDGRMTDAALRVEEGKSGLHTPRKRQTTRQATEMAGDTCACPTPDAPTRPSVVLDPFAGTGTTVAVANALGRHGIGVDLSADYLQVARWRCADPKLRAKVLGTEKPAPEVPGQMVLIA